MSVHLVAISVISTVMLVYWHVMFRHILKQDVSGDAWYIRRFAFCTSHVSAPYCYRPLVPWLARWLGFRVVSLPCIWLTPLLVYGYVGGGEVGLACGLLWIGNPHISGFNVRNPEYVDGVGQCLLVGTLWAMSVGSLWAFPMAILCGLCRETVSAVVIVVGMVTGSSVWVLAAVGSLIAWAVADEDRDNTHPLIEKTHRGTWQRWLLAKGDLVRHYAVTLQPLRCAPLALPFVWHELSDFSRMGLWGLLAVWVLAWPASGQSRIVTYGLALLVPAVAACGAPWVWLFVFAAWFWPIEIRVYEECGDRLFGIAR